MYENGADSSNLKISWIHKNLIFITRIAPWEAMDFPWPQGIVNIRLDVWQKAAREHAYDYWTLDANRTHRTTKSSKNCLATKRDRAIDLSCRACGAGAWALGLDSRLGTPASLPFSTPNLQLILRVVAELGILRVVAELQNSWDVKSTPKSLKFLAKMKIHLI